MTDTIYTDNSKVNSALVAENERLQARLEELEGSEMACIKTLVNIRFACGDNGKRMQDELVEYIAELSRKAVSVPEWQLEAKRAFWAGIEIAESFNVVAIAPRWDEYIAKRKEDLSQYVTRAGDGDE